MALEANPMDVASLIALVKEHPELYDTAHPSYKDISTKDYRWKEIAKKLNVPRDAAKMRWKSLRDSYTKYLKMLPWKSNKRRTMWSWAKEMSFLTPYLCLEPRKKSKRKISLDGLLESEDGTDGADVTQSSTVYAVDEEMEVKLEPMYLNAEVTNETMDLNGQGKGQAVYELTESDKKFETPSSEVLYVQNKTCHNLDALEHLFLGYAKTVKTFAPSRQVVVKMRIAQLIMEEELLHLQGAKQDS